MVANAGVSSPSRMKRIRSFEPIVGRRFHVLVLGTMPGPKSHAAGEYYAHPQNAFWRFVAPWGAAPEASYRERCAALKRAGIGLWDVLASCEREGALDQHIRRPELNDFQGLLGRRRSLRLILCNDKKAYDLFRRFVELPRPIECRALPSTSPANARRGKEEEWHGALREVLGAP